MPAVFGKTVDASAELLGSKQIQNSFQISGSAEASSWFLHVFVALFFVLAHFFTFSWWACTCIQILSLCLSLHMIGSMMCPSKRSDWRFSSCWLESAVFFLVQRTDSKSWLVPHRHITLFSASWLYSLHYIIHCKKKENLCQKMIVSLFLSISAWK